MGQATASAAEEDLSAQASAERVAFARETGWKRVRLLSAAGSSFRCDYGGHSARTEAVPIMTVFKRDPEGTIRLHWAREMIHAPTR